jgi:hypothetical protein
MQHILTSTVGILIGHLLVGVNPCGKCAIAAPLPQIAKLPKKSQKNGFKICELILSMRIAPLLNEGNILSFGDDLSGGSIKKPTPI